MIELIVNKKSIDLLPDFDILLNKEVINEFGKNIKLVDWSYEIELPTSLNNNEIFRNINILDVHDKFNQLYDAELYIDGTFVFNGKLVINEVSRESYNCNLFTVGKKELSDIFGDKMLNEIMPHHILVNKLEDIYLINRFIVDKFVGIHPHICFPYVLYRLPFNFLPDENLYNDKYYHYTQIANGVHTSDQGANIDLYSFVPSFNVLSVLKDCFKDAGYQLGGNILNHELFHNLYQTFSYDYDKYCEELGTPQYLSFRLKYNSLMSNTYTYLRDTTYDLQYVSELENFHVGFSNLLKANYKIKENLLGPSVVYPLNINNISNDYNMLTLSDSYHDIHSTFDITINKSGWYQMNITNLKAYYSDGSLNHVLTYGTDGVQMMDIGGTHSISDPSDIHSKPIEIQIKKSSSGNELNEVHYYSLSGYNPTTRASISDDSVLRKNRDSAVYDAFVKIELPANKFMRNRYVGTILTDLLNFDTESIITLFRFGEYKARGWGSLSGALLPNLLNLPKYDGLNRYDTSDNTRYIGHGHSEMDNPSPYYTNCAYILNNRKGYYNYGGAYVLNPDTHNWTLDSGYTIPGQVYGSIIGTDDNTMMDNHTCIWLDKGDSLEIQMVCGTVKSGNREWLPNVHVEMDFEMYIVNNNKNWVPSTADPIPPRNVAISDMYTNFNKFLPNIKVNDFINGILKTFNCFLTNAGNNTYNIDTLNNYNDEVVNLVNLDLYANPANAKMKRLDIPSKYELKWKVDKEEIGYIEGNTNYVDSNVAYPYANYEGSREYLNPLNNSGDITSIESLWSFNWYKKIRFLHSNIPTTRDIPVIMSKDDWNATIYNTKSKTDLLPRLFYLVDEPNTDYLVHETLKVNMGIYDEDVYIYFPIPHWKNTYTLDYNEDVENPISNFFNIKFNNNYQVDIDAIVPIEMFNIVNINTKVIFNDSVYDISKIEGYSTDRFATWSLLTQ